MVKRWLRKQADGHHAGSVANRCRFKRMQLFEEFFYENYKDAIDRKEIIRILDMGGTYSFWKSLGFSFYNNVDITLVNVIEIPVPAEVPNIHAIVASATELRGIKDKEFDLVFSNSCIEHVGKIDEQTAMAAEIKRVGFHYYLQTPNRYFPLEPHFLFPLFQFLPLAARTFLVQRFQLGFMPKGKSKDDAKRIADEVCLLSYSNLKQMFPRASIKREKLFGLTKSFMVFE